MINRWTRVRTVGRSLTTVLFARVVPIDDLISQLDRLQLQTRVFTPVERNQVLPLVRGDLKFPGDRVVQFRPTK